MALERYRRKAGEVLHATHESREALEIIRQNLGPYNFAGQYQQAPAPLGGGLIQAQWLLPYDVESVRGKPEKIIQSWDTANKPTELSDYSVCTTWAIFHRHFYLLHVFRKRLGYPELKRAVIEQRTIFDADVILIEDKGSGISLIQDLIAGGTHGVTRYEPEGDKIMRAHAQTGTIESGFVHVPQAAPWLDDYIHELAVFPNGQYDDQVDSTVQVLDWYKSGDSFRGIIEYYNREVERLQTGRHARVGQASAADFVRLRAPNPHANYYVSGTNGRAGRYSADADGIIEKVHPEDVQKLLAQNCVRV